MASQKQIRITINGKIYERIINSRTLLVDFLREELGLTGTHIGCEHGICGACTVLFNGEPSQSCLLFAIQADEAEIFTIEGLKKDGVAHPLQVAFSESHGLQCGFCTPGMVLSAYFLLSRVPNPSEEEIRIAISGNLCRCTGYVNIIKAVKLAAARINQK